MPSDSSRIVRKPRRPLAPLNKDNPAAHGDSSDKKSGQISPLMDVVTPGVIRDLLQTASQTGGGNHARGHNYPDYISDRPKDRGRGGRDGNERVVALNELSKIVCSMRSIHSLHQDWRETAGTLIEIIAEKGKNTVDTRKAAATTLGAIGGLLYDQHIEFLDLLEETSKGWKSSTGRVEESMAALVSALGSSVVALTNRGCPESVDSNRVLAFVVTLMDSSKILASFTACLEVFSTIVVVTQVDPTALHVYLKDVLDFAVGWMVAQGSDRDVTFARLASVRNSLINLGDAWMGSMDLMEDMMRQIYQDLIEGVRAVQSDLPAKEGRRPVRSIANTLGVLLQISQHYAPLTVRSIGGDVYTVLLSEWSTQGSGTISHSAVARVFASLVDILAQCIPAMLDEDNVEMAKQLLTIALLNSAAPPLLVAVYDFITKLNSVCSEAVIVPVATAFFDPLTGPFRALPLPLPTPAAAAALKRMLISLLNPNLLSILQLSYGALVPALSASIRGVPNETAQRECSYRVSLILGAMRHLLVVKNSLIVMLGLSPSLFDIFVSSSTLGESELQSRSPALHLALLTAAKDHCAAHEYFAMTSDWMSSASSRLGQSHTSAHAAHQIALIGRLLGMDTLTSREARVLLGEWAIEVTDRLGALMNDPSIAARPEIVALLAGIERSQVIAPETTARLAPLAAHLQRLSGEKAIECRDATGLRAAVINAHSDKRVLALWSHVDVDALKRSYRMDSSSSWENVYGRPLLLAASAQQFHLLMNFLLKRTPPIESANVEKDDAREDWLLLPSSPCSVTSEWRRRLLASAAYAIEAKMTTPLGKPKDTLQAISAELARLAKGAIAGREDDGDNLLSRREDWFRIRALLEWIEALDRLVFIAVSGSMAPSYTPSQPARAWFVTNAGVMAEWFGRVYPSAMAVAFHSGAYSQVIRFMWSALPELEKRKAKNGETAAPPLALITAAWGVRAMAEIGDAASIDGIESWAQRMYPDERWAWVEGAKRLAEGRFEDAIAILQRESIGRNFSETLTQSVQALLVSALSRIRESITLTKVNLDEEAMTKCRHLTQFSKIEKVAPPSAQSTPSWDLAKGLHATELWLMSTIKKSQVSECRRDVGLEGAATLMWDEDGIVASRYASLSLLASSLALRMDKGPHWANTHCSSLVVPSLASQLVDGPEALALARQQLGWTTRLGMCPPQMAAHLATAKLARATCNSLTMLAHLEHVTMNGGGQMHLVLTTQLQKSKLALATRSPSDWSKEKWKMVPAIADAFEVHARLKMEEAISGVQCQTEEAALVEVMSRCCLRLASWVGEEERIGVHVPMSRLHHDLEARRGETSLDEKGALLHLAVSLSPALAKAYRSFADHVLSLAESGRSTEERARQILSMEVGPDEAEPIVRAMRESTTLAQLEANLLKSAMYYDIPTLVNDVVAGVWADMQGRRALLFTQAIDGHFQFLRLAGATEGKSSSSVGVVSSTLRILHVLTRYAALYGLEGAIEGGLAVCDEALWKEILPQLFARLSHPLKSVRAIIVKLLARIGESSPHAIVYQAIVGAKSADLGGDLVDVEEAEEEAGPSSKQRSTVFDCCRQLERSLEAHSPRLVAQVKAFVRELQKLNLTDEKWSYVLTHLDMDMARRLRHVRGEKERTRLMVHIPEARKRAIVREKAEIILGPVFRILSDLLARTKAAAAAGLEDAKRFLTLYDGEIRAAFAERPMREDLMEDDEEEARWIPFKKLCASVASRTSRRGGHSIDIGLVAKGLYKCEEGGWDVPLPGQEDLALENVVRMRSVCHQAIVLATKTRPKKLTLMTTEGREVVYLFKGHEDLHLDERIMQLLHMCNLMLGSRSKREWPAYTARNYAVTPLGTLSGLIQWVEGATPVYQIYRKWQQREAYKTPLNGKPTALPDVIALKPIELYHKRLKELFETNNLDSRSMSSRRNWPSEILLELFTGLLDETPKDLISRELWLRSRSSAHWMRTTATFARSTAVMGMIGSLLGLGDRHLDNLLLDLDGAHLVHIDYNVCFDKGRVLKVPETVPFRLTQNIVHALGPTQIDGVFSTSCASVLESLRSHSSLFSFLLDAFLYDPLVDWTSQRDALSSNVAAAVTLLVYGDEVKAEEDRPLAKRLFCLRIDELRELLCRGRDDIFAILTAWRSTVISGLRPALSPDDALALHMKLWQDLRPLLKNIATKDEVFAAYCADYRRHVTETIATFASICNDPTSNALELLPLLDQMEVAIPRAYDSLFGLEARAKASGGATGGNKVAAVSAPPGFEDMAPVASSEGTNALAAFTVRQIIDKVEGRVDPCDRSRIVPPAEYASTLISSASSLSSLSLMYEGWTAWV